jgi:hypothetical protein
MPPKKAAGAKAAPPRPAARPQLTEEEAKHLTTQAELDILEAIRSGDLEKIKLMDINPRGIDTRLGVSADTIVYPSQSGEVHIEKIAGPTVLVYSILCERANFVQYFLSKFDPDMSFAPDGWTPFHFACTTRDPSCLKVLLQHEYVQENINVGIDSSSDTHTTGLHLAVVHRLHESVFILTRPFPPVQYPSLGQKRPNRIATSAPNAAGDTPMHCAVRAADWDMVQVLINAGADTSAVNRAGRSPFDLARGQLIRLFEEGEIESRAALERRYMSEFRTVDRTRLFYDAIFGRLDKVKRLLALIQESIKSDEEKTCSICEDAVGELCAECNQYFCRTCWSEAMHRCGTQFPQ